MWRVARRAAVVARELSPTFVAADQAARRRSFILRTRAAAFAAHARVKIDVAPDAQIGRAVRVVFEPETNNVLHIGPRSLVADHVLIQLKGGSMRVGGDVQLRRGCIFNVAGDLSVEDDCILSWGTVVHCSTRIHVDSMVIIGEYSTLVDSSHYFTEPDAPVWHNVRTGSVDIGRNTWLGAKAVVARDAKIGSHCIVAANSVVVGEVPSGSLASGVPATVRPLSLPW